MRSIEKRQELLADMIEEGLVKPLRKHQFARSHDELDFMARLFCHEEATISDVCSFLHVLPRKLFELRKRRDFPKPFKEVGHQPVWWKDEISGWLEKNSI